MSARILLIEDNPTNLELMSYLLGAFGYRPQTAADGAVGVKMASAEPFDLIVCDIHMPMMDGYEVARQLKSDPSLRSTPLVAVTALAMVGDRDRVLAAGFDGYIAKPIDPETFVSQVETFLKNANRFAASQFQSAEPQPLSQSPTGATILVVDNLVVNLELARSILEPHGYRVLTAVGPDQGLAVLREYPCDLILSDVCMSGETGYDFIKRVKSDPRFVTIPFIFLTATLTNEADRARGLSLGAAQFLFRPLEPEVLLAEIEACLRGAKR